MKTSSSFSLLLLLSVLFLGACDSVRPADDLGDAGEGELITRVVLTLTADGTTATAEANDPDGDGTNLQIDDLVVASGTTYQGKIHVFDDVNGENVGEEVAAEAEEHQFFFETGGAAAARLSVEATDTDANGLPVGLNFQVVVSDGQPGSATLRIILSHFDEQPKDGTTRSDETDIDVTFPVTIQ